MKITIAQLNPVVGDISGNLRKIEHALERSKSDQSDLLVLPELFLTGYPPRDLLERQWFINRTQSGIEHIAKLSGEYPDIGILVGVPMRSGSDVGVGLHNSAILIFQGDVIFRQDKMLLPTYDVFDEARYFDPATETDTVNFKGERLGISICEDAWNDAELWPIRSYPYDPIEILVKKGASVLINISASPFRFAKDTLRHELVCRHAKKHGLPFVFVNQIGANDDLIFDGRSMFIDGNGDMVESCPAFTEHLVTVDTGAKGSVGLFKPQDEIGSICDALVLGISDYMRKCGFTKAVVGLSGGVDSALTCALAVKAVGGENVLGVTMPSPYSSEASVELSKKLSENLGIEIREIPITGVYEAYLDALRSHLKNPDEINVTLENAQARIRGNILMALSNEYGNLVLSTGNKSELSVGYCTLYGDMSGGLAVISDVPKTMVYKLAEYINTDREIIPKETITRPPSAELRPDQKDQDTLPPYDELDEILRLYIDEAVSKEEIVKRGFDAKTVDRVAWMVNVNEYKRRQAAPGLRVTSKAFGMGRRMPIAAKFEG